MFLAHRTHERSHDEAKTRHQSRSGQEKTDARRLVRDVLKNAQRIDLKDASRGKYFRIVAKVEADGVDLAAYLIVKDLAVPYDGGTKVKDWCDQEGPND